MSDPPQVPERSKILAPARMTHPAEACSAAEVYHSTAETAMCGGKTHCTDMHCSLYCSRPQMAAAKWRLPAQILVQ